MISAVQLRKTNIELKEDTLTSVVFDNLFHLPDSLFWDIIKKSCFENHLPYFINFIDLYEFWPHWDHQNTENERYVEPDLFIRFDNFDLIIESKWNKQQYYEQWKKEIIGYKNVYEKDKKNVYLLAIGGINNENEENIDIENYGSIKVAKCKWNNILEAIVNIKSKINNYCFSEINNIIRIINTIITGLEMHGFIYIHWLDDMINNIYYINLENTYEIMSNWRIE